jgi:hypothetical protein
VENGFEMLLEKERILDTVNDLFVGTDERDWERVASALASRVLFDARSMTGAAPETLEAAAIIARWTEGLRPLKAVHHQTGNFRVRVSGEEADVFCYATASHYLPNRSGRNSRVFVGSYDLHLTRQAGAWRIDLFRFQLKYIDGNLDLENED